MFYVKHLTHAHFVRGRTNIPRNVSSVGLRSGSPQLHKQLTSYIFELLSTILSKITAQTA